MVYVLKFYIPNRCLKFYENKLTTKIALRNFISLCTNLRKKKWNVHLNCFLSYDKKNIYKNNFWFDIISNFILITWLAIKYIFNVPDANILLLEIHTTQPALGMLSSFRTTEFDWTEEEIQVYIGRCPCLIIQTAVTF